MKIRVGIVGSEAAKFTPETERKAREAIRTILGQARVMISGHCHLGGIDIWAEEEADRIGVDAMIFPPFALNWNDGYRPRNLKIAQHSDVVYCITLKELPPSYTGMEFDGCYHCANSENGCKEPHVKSGGCWTALKCERREWIII